MPPNRDLDRLQTDDIVTLAISARDNVTLAVERYLGFPEPVSFDDDWVNDVAHKEESARERDLQAKRERWAALDRAELQGQGETVKRAKRARRSDRWRKTWPWLVSAGSRRR